PSEKTIYKYLNGDVSIPIELVTYIAEALNVSEQELFDHSFEAKCRLCKMMFKTSSGNELQKLKSNFTVLTELKQKEGIAEDKDYEHQVARLIELMPYAPYPLLKKINNSLAKIASIAEKTRF
ncbi:MAG: helix-turn-helix domain-containing protein, partial [Campylobacterota bacterium]